MRWLTIILMLLILWGFAFFQFLNAIPKLSIGDAVSTDTIVVLTGGSLRVAHGLESLARRDAKKLFITGVGEGVSVDALLEANNVPDYIRTMAEGKVFLGYQATDTRGNAQETAEWIKRERYRSIRLVTANYHQPRALIEFQHVMPEVVMVSDPVFPKEFKTESWWKDDKSRMIILSEFHKYLLAWIQLVLLNPLFL